MPYILLIFGALVNGIFGYSEFSGKIYGIDAFVETIVLWLFVLGVFLLPIIPYQIFYLIYMRSKKIGSVKRAIINVISIAMVVCSIGIIILQVYQNNGLNKTKGVVIGHEKEIVNYGIKNEKGEHEIEEREEYRPIVKYEVAGETYTDTTYGDKKVGELVTIYYHQNYPERIRYKENYITFIVILMLTGVGLILWDKKKHAKEKFDI